MEIPRFELMKVVNSFVESLLEPPCYDPETATKYSIFGMDRADVMDVKRAAELDSKDESIRSRASRASKTVERMMARRVPQPIGRNIVSDDDWNTFRPPA